MLTRRFLETVTDVQKKLVLIRVRQLVTQLCTRTKHGRWWFYRVVLGEVSCLAELSVIDELLSQNPPISPVAIAREEASVLLNRAIDRAELARKLKISRQTVSLWESQPDSPADRLDRVRKALREIV